MSPPFIRGTSEIGTVPYTVDMGYRTVEYRTVHFPYLSIYSSGTVRYGSVRYGTGTGQYEVPYLTGPTPLAAVRSCVRRNMSVTEPKPYCTAVNSNIS